MKLHVTIEIADDTGGVHRVAFSHLRELDYDRAIVEFAEIMRGLESSPYSPLRIAEERALLAEAERILREGT